MSYFSFKHRHGWNKTNGQPGSHQQLPLHHPFIVFIPPQVENTTWEQPAKLGGPRTGKKNSTSPLEYISLSFSLSLILPQRLSR